MKTTVEGFHGMAWKYTDLQELTAEFIRELVERIYVYQGEKKDGRKLQRVRIVWNFIGEFQAPIGVSKEKSA